VLGITWWYGISRGYIMPTIKRKVFILEHVPGKCKSDSLYKCERCGKQKTYRALGFDLENETRFIYMCQPCMYTFKNQLNDAISRKQPIYQYD